MPPLQQAETETLKEAFNTGGGAGYVLDFPIEPSDGHSFFSFHLSNLVLDARRYRCGERGRWQLWEARQVGASRCT